MKKSKPFFLLAFVLLYSCNYQDTKQSETEIQALIQDYYKTMSDRKWEEYRTFFWSDATITTLWQADEDSPRSVFTTSIDEFISKTSEGPDSQPIFEEKMLSSSIEIRNNLATVWTKYSAKFGTEENLYEWEGTDLFTLLRHNGEWKIVSLTFESDE